jgi:sugar transferase (PEP-CTERM system associated)
MVRIFGISVRATTLIISVLEGCLIAFTALSLHQVGRGFPAIAQAGIDLQLGADIAQQVLLSTGALWLAMHVFGLYERAVWPDISVLVRRLLIAILIGGLAASVASQLFLGKTPPSDFALALAFLTFTNILIVRMLVVTRLPTAVHSNTVLLVGAGDRAHEICQAAGSWSDTATVIHGVWQVQESERLAVPRELLVRVRGTLSDYVRARGIDEVVVALDDRRGRLPVTELLDCRLNGVRVTDAATFLERETRKVDLDNLYPSWLIFGEGFHSTRAQAVVKRALDLAMSALLLFAVWPLMLATALAIRLDSPGPIIYRQSRVGLHGKVFDVFKFRSMRADAEADGQARWASVKDERITRVGSFIRKTRMDELPQLFCVFKGDMSFVGPRPERPEFVNELAARIPYYGERHRVKPGITGWAQVNYSYGASAEDAREKLKYDLFYTKHHGLLLDLMIMIKTVRVVFWGEGAR